jgi:transposase-like protein
VVKVRDGQVANRPIYAAIGVSLDGEKHILGLRAGTGGEGAKFWMAVLTGIKNRGVADVFFLVCDGLKGLPEVVANVWPLTTVQTCILHLIRGTFHLASKRDWDALKRGIKPICPRPARPRPGRPWTSSPGPGGSATARSSGCGRTHDPGSSRSWTTTWRSAR